MGFHKIIEKMSIFQKVWLSMSVLIAAYCITSILSFISKESIQKELENIAKCSESSTSVGQTFLSEIEKQMQIYMDSVLTGEISQISNAEEHMKASIEALKELTAIKYNSPETIKVAMLLNDTINQYGIDATQVYSGMISGDYENKFVDKASELTKRKVEMLKMVGDFNRMVTADLTKVLKQTGLNVERQKWRESITLIITLLASILAVTFMVSKYIIKPINKIIEGLQEITEKASDTSDTISATGQSLADGSVTQADSIEKTSTAVKGMLDKTNRNENNAKEADDLMTEANQIVARANDSMAQLTNSMDAISQASEETSKIIKTIDEIAFQTNLLSLNAAVEAARAGKAGVGFAVVAKEVRTLALRATDEAKTTEKLINETTTKVKDGSSIVKSTNEAFLKIASSSTKTGVLISEIVNASHEQTSDIKLVNETLSEINKVTRHNSAAAEKSISTLREMKTQTNNILQYVRNLMQLVGVNKKREGHSAGTVLNEYGKRNHSEKIVVTGNVAPGTGKSEMKQIHPATRMLAFENQKGGLEKHC